MTILQTIERVEEKNNLKNDLWFQKIKKYVKDANTRDFETVDIVEEKKEKSLKTFIDELVDVMSFINKVSTDVSDWDTDAIYAFIALKKIEKTLKKSMDSIKDLATDYVEENPNQELPFGANGKVTTPMKIDYDSNEEYKKLNDDIKDLKEFLKTVAENSKKNLATIDADGNIVEVPEFTFTKTLKISKI